MYHFEFETDLSTDLSTTIEIARAAHEGQVDKAGMKSIKYEEYEDCLKRLDEIITREIFIISI